MKVITLLEITALESGHTSDEKRKKIYAQTGFSHSCDFSYNWSERKTVLHNSFSLVGRWTLADHDLPGFHRVKWILWNYQTLKSETNKNVAQPVILIEGTYEWLTNATSSISETHFINLGIAWEIGNQNGSKKWMESCIKWSWKDCRISNVISKLAVLVERWDYKFGIALEKVDRKHASPH